MWPKAKFEKRDSSGSHFRLQASTSGFLDRRGVNRDRILDAARIAAGQRDDQRHTGRGERRRSRCDPVRRRPSFVSRRPPS